MTATNRAAGRRRAVSEVKRKLILDAARRVFEAEGLEGASLRAIAAEAGYTPAALYFHFPSKEAIYGEVLRQSLDRLRQAVADAVAREVTPAARLKAAAMAFFGFYAVHPRDLDLGFYLLRGGMQPRGLGRELDEQLNLALGQALLPIAEAAEALGASPEEARSVLVDAFAHAAGLLMLAHTGRIRMFAVSAQQQMDRYVDGQIADLMQA